MINISYYRQNPIMRRLLEYLDGALFQIGVSPYPNAYRHHRRIGHITEGVEEGLDIHRSILDEKKLLFVVDIEYGNRDFPGHAFHMPYEVFEKLEPSRLAIKDIMDEHSIPYVELMTGQGYNFVSSVNRKSPSYKALLSLGVKLRAVPWTAFGEMSRKEKRFGNHPIIADSIAYAALGRIQQYMVDYIRGKTGTLPLRSSDIFDGNEIVIFDTSQFGHHIVRRSKRCAFSLYQKAPTDPKYNYHGPPLVTIPSKGLAIAQRIETRSDERDNYKLAVNLSRDTSVEIPEADLASLMTSYFVSPAYQRDIEHAQQLGTRFPDTDVTMYVEKLREVCPGADDATLFWDIPYPNWDAVNAAQLSETSRFTLSHPNDQMLKPKSLRCFIQDMKVNGFDDRHVMSVIAEIYRQNHGWNSDITKNDPMLMADYWVRTLKDQHHNLD